VLGRVDAVPEDHGGCWILPLPQIGPNQHIIIGREIELDPGTSEIEGGNLFLNSQAASIFRVLSTCSLQYLFSTLLIHFYLSSTNLK
jgi:hypothetical protein